MIDELLKKYMANYFAENKTTDFEELENLLPQLFDKWSNTYDATLGKTPIAYYESITDGGELVKMLISYEDSNLSPNSLLLTRIVKVPSAAPALVEYLENGSNEELRITAFSLLTQMERVPLGDCTDMVFDPSTPPELREVLVDFLKDNVDKVKETLLERTELADESAREILADILANAYGDERVYSFLSEMLLSSENIPLIASCLTRFGDSRAINNIKTMMKTCKYADYLELRNTVEALGGEVEDDRTWSDDDTYMIIKGDKNNSQEG